MLDRNRMQPPPSPASQASWCDWSGSACGGLFASAEDYDATGILAGVDPCESRYWWMPEMHATPALSGQPAVAGGHAGILERALRAAHAARRTGSRSTAAA
jgi:hypothetical protein